MTGLVNDVYANIMTLLTNNNVKAKPTPFARCCWVEFLNLLWNWYAIIPYLIQNEKYVSLDVFRVKSILDRVSQFYSKFYCFFNITLLM